MFAYCGNNPIDRADHTGTSWFKTAIKWAVQKVIKPAKKVIETTVSKINKTYSVGLSLGGSLATLVGSGQVGVSVDTKGNIAVQRTNAGGGSVSSGKVGGAIGVYSMHTNAPTVEHLNGYGGQIGGTVAMPLSGIPAAAAVDLNVIPDYSNGKTYIGVTNTRGIGTPGAEFHAMISSTSPHNDWRINIYDIGDNILDAIMEW